MAEAMYRHPKVVVSVPAYNEVRFIGETLRSVQEQTHEDFLCVISDNASTDRTGAICREFAAKDSRFVYVRQPENIGSAGNLNFLLRVTDSPYHVWLGAHDLLHPRFLSHHIAALDASPDATLSYSVTQWIDESGENVTVTPASRLVEKRGPPWLRYIRTFRTVHEGTAMNQLMRRSALEGFTALEYPVAADRVLLSRLVFMGKICHTEEPLYYRRLFESRSSDFMERITGRKDQPKVKRDLIAAFLRDMDVFPASRVEKLIFKSISAVLLRDRYYGGVWSIRRRAASFLGLRKPTPAVPTIRRTEQLQG